MTTEIKWISRSESLSGVAELLTSANQSGSERRTELDGWQFANFQANLRHYVCDKRETSFHCAGVLLDEVLTARRRGMIVNLEDFGEVCVGTQAEAFPFHQETVQPGRMSTLTSGQLQRSMLSSDHMVVVVLIFGFD